MILNKSGFVKHPCGLCGYSINNKESLKDFWNYERGRGKVGESCEVVVREIRESGGDLGSPLNSKFLYGILYYIINR
jgi:hypothetical protein